MAGRFAYFLDPMRLFNGRPGYLLDGFRDRTIVAAGFIGRLSRLADKLNPLLDLRVRGADQN